MPPDHLGPGGPGDRGAHQVDRTLPGRDVHPGRGVAGTAGHVATGDSKRCLPRFASSTGSGYLPSKQARQSWLAGRVVASVSPSSEMKPSESAPIESRISCHRQAARDELGPGREVDPVEAGPGHRGAGDPHVHFGGARLAQHPDDRALRVAAHDRIIHHNDPLAGDDIPQRVQLEADAALPDRLARLDEGPADVGVLDQPLAVGDAAGLRVADGGRGAGLRHRDDQVGLDRVLGSQHPADLHPGGLHAAPGDGGVRPGQVDVLE